MIATRESVAEFLKSKVTSDLAGITDPEMKFAVRSNTQPPEFPNCLNWYNFDDEPIGQYNPHYRILTSSLELLIQVDANSPLASERQAYTCIHKINQFMAVQSIQKKDYSVTPVVNLGSQIQWRDSYPLSWTSVPDSDERYIHKSAFIMFRYFEEAIVNSF